MVSNSDGSGASWYHRDPVRFRDLLARSVVLHRRLRQEWDALQGSYRRQLDEVVGPQAWIRTFGIVPAGSKPRKAAVKGKKTAVKDGSRKSR